MSSKSARHLLHALLVLLLAWPPLASSVHAQETNIAARLVADGNAAPGETAWLAIEMTPEHGWHGYWSNPGDAGIGMQLDWSLPEGYAAGEAQYPVPSTLVISDLMNHVYKGAYAVLVPVEVPADARRGARVPISVDAQWLACTDEICVPEKGRLQTTLTVGGAASDARFDRWRAKLPAPLDSDASFAFAGDTVRIAIPLPRTVELEAPHLFIGEDRVVKYAAEQEFARAGDVLVVTLRRAGYEPESPRSLTGVLRLNRSGDGIAFEAAPGAVPQDAAPIAMEKAAAALSLPALLLAALAGGLLLNLMPCVFPILSLKALGLARSGGSATQARTEGFAYTAGVVLATVALGALLLALRAAGEEIGWAFQLQEPLVVALLLALAAAITANFVGLFEVTSLGLAGAGPAQGGEGASGAFATGLLAAFVATPCTGPFMAAAMGAALLLPVAPALALFAALGFGLALPFLAIGLFPPLRRILPKPGAWMTTFRRWMALPMGLTALALVWLAWRIGGTGFAIAATLLALMLVAMLVVVGRRQRAGRPNGAPMLAGLAALVAVAVFVLPALEQARGADRSAETILASQPYSADALAAARASGKPVFAYFTADWCITCKVNEKAAIERDATKQAFEAAGVEVLRGDWTRRDPEITRYLAEHGAAGVPLYVWYPGAGAAAQVLPQVLTPNTLPDLAAKSGET